MSNRLRVQAAVSEFLHTWTCGGKASLHLDTSEGGCTVSFTAHFAHHPSDDYPPCHCSSAVATTSTSSSVIRRQPCCTPCGLPVKGHKGPLGSRCPALESLRGPEGDSSLNASPGKDGERDVSCWNCEVPREVPLTPTHQCDEVVNCDEINYTHQGKYRDERGVNYNSSSDASDIAQRCPECPECSVERHAALFREK